MSTVLMEGVSVRIILDGHGPRAPAHRLTDRPFVRTYVAPVEIAVMYKATTTKFYYMQSKQIQKYFHPQAAKIEGLGEWRGKERNTNIIQSY